VSKVSILNFVQSVAVAVLVTSVSSIAMAQQGSADAGAGKVAVCVACHGENGNDSALPNVPKLGARGERYLLKQLQDIKSGKRSVPLMSGMLNTLSDQDLADVAAYYDSQPLALGAVDEAKRALGEQLYRAGNEELGVAACTACHQPDGKGLAAAGYPALSGQDVAYTDLALRAFRSGERANDATLPSCVPSRPA
jgi:cytochrome c553